MMSMNFKDIAISETDGVEYGCIITRIWKSEARNLTQKIDLNKKSGTWYIYIYIIQTRMIKETLTFDIEIEKYKFYYHKSLIFL